jgi:hypothetical protein
MSKNIIFITEQTFKERTGASNQIDAKQLFPMIKVAGDVHIQPALGSQLYKRLQLGVEGDNLTPDEETLINDYLTDTLIWYTMSMLPMTMGFQLFSKGFLQKTAEDSNAPSRGDLEMLESKYLSLAEFYKTRMIKYLQENYTLYYEYFNTGSGFDVIFPEEKGYACPIYLGDRDYMRYPRYNNSTSGYAAPNYITYTAAAGISTFTISTLVGRTILLAVRSGLVKSITTTTTADTEFLQIVNGVITLPTGDVTIANEKFIFQYR